MRDLASLGISPAPWHFVHDDNRTIVASCDGRILSIVYADMTSEKNVNNSRLIAAAPSLYEALRETIVALQNRLPQHPTHNEVELVISAYRALAAASGESEVSR